MWSDTLLALERSHVVRLVAWALGSVVTGSMLLVWIVVRKRVVPLLFQFALQSAAWGAVLLAVAIASWRNLALRDYAGAMHLQHVLWLNVGFDVGYAGVGATLAITCFVLGRRMGGVGAGVAIVVQALALLLLDVQLLALIGPMR